MTIAEQYPDLVGLAPMLASSAPGIPGPDATNGPFAYEPKWDGFRAIVLLADGEVEIYSRNGKPMTRYFPDVVAAVREELPDPCAVDGEIVLVHGARLDFDLLGQRIHPADSRVRMLAERAPATLVVFDLLALGDDVLLERPLSERIEVLDGLGPLGPRVQATPRTLDPEVAAAWFDSFEGAGLDGVVAKPLAGPYAPNKRAMTKVKHARTADVVLAGYRPHKDSTPERPLVGSLLLGLYAGSRLQFVGVSASFPMARRAELVEELADLRVDLDDDAATAAHPWGDWADPAAHAGGRKPGAVSRWSGGKDLSFVPLRPERVLEVGYDHMEGDRFRHTTQFKRWRPDRDPSSCTYDQLDEVAGYDLDEILPGAPAADPDFHGQ
ncbi:ATP-dependent DNA ligase [Salana multivorans]|uniref:DNA ligase (ATP) n=1 Tax=Salana multivorans TaxID=120377 RepID=A0A3N2D909_9MICO|nr:ATP-dependent DNA ligase [Salana multivorans]MBN8881407.1 ATP-dependent DNA ligase [Salana multivorans]OJX97382.1 MAG: ATP-dependent DNA ligase [Micrococcales bacterium 73-15]ROR96275.1 ATP-dependent DNA ligase [Salana multivorans]